MCTSKKLCFHAPLYACQSAFVWHYIVRVSQGSTRCGHEIVLVGVATDVKFIMLCN